MLIIKYITSLIEKPYAKKHYLDLINYLNSINRDKEAEAFSSLFEVRFPQNGNNNPPSNSEQ